MATLLIRTFIIYIFFILAIKLMGKRQVGEIQVSELVITLLLSELASYPVTDPNIPLLYSIIPIITLLAVEITVSYLGVKDYRFKKIFVTNPAILVERGIINQQALKDSRFTVGELISEVRLKGYVDLTNIDYAILESNGKLSVIPKSEYSQPTAAQLNLPVENNFLSQPVIINGELNSKAINEIKKSSEFVLKKLSEAGYTSINDVFLMLMSEDDKYTIQKKAV